MSFYLHDLKDEIFALFFGFLKTSDHMVNVFEELKLLNNPSSIQQLANIHLNHM